MIYHPFTEAGIFMTLLADVVQTQIAQFLSFTPPAVPLPSPTKEELAATIDHTLLKAEALPSQVKQLGEEANQYQFASVCVNSVYVPLARQVVTNPAVKICTVVGFPLGAMLTSAKVAETEAAIRAGANEIDMVLPIGLLKAGAYEEVYKDIAAVVDKAHYHYATVKVIIETSLLTQAEKISACVLSQQAQADFVKTSTGFSTGGATTADIALMRAVVGPEMGVKASGGIRTRADALAMIAAGANRLGASAGVQIIHE